MWLFIVSLVLLVLVQEGMAQSDGSVLQKSDMEGLSPVAAMLLLSLDCRQVNAGLAEVEREQPEKACALSLKLLAHPDPMVRHLADGVIGRCKGENTRESLLQLLKADDWKARAAAAETLRWFEPNGFKEDLFLALKDPNETVAMCAALTLAHHGTQEDLSRLSSLGAELENREQRATWMAVILLGRRIHVPPTPPVEEEQLVSAVRSALHCSSIAVQEDCLPLLPEICREGNIPELMALLIHPNSNVRACAVRLLGELGVRESVPKLMEFLENYGKEAPAAARALGSLGATEALPRLEDLFRVKIGPSEMVASVVYALGCLGADHLIPEIAPLLCRDDLSVRRAAATTLGQLGAWETIPGLLRLLEEDAGALQPEAEEALRRIVGRDGDTSETVLRATELLEKKKKSPNPEVRRRAVAAFSLWGEEGGLPHLVELLSDEHPEVRKDAANALKSLGASSVIRFLAQAALEEAARAGVKPRLELLVHAVRDLGPDKSMEELDRLIQTEDPKERALAQALLAELKQDPAFSEVLKRLETGKGDET